MGNMTMTALCNWFRDGKGTNAPNDSMSFVDVRDCATQHLVAMEDETATGRYMSLEPSMLWNELVTLMKDIYPKMPPSLPSEGTPCNATQFDLTRRNSLVMNFMKVPE